MTHHADLIFLNGDIITVNESNPAAEALAVKDGKIMAVGREDQVLQSRGPETELVGLEGRTLMPGLIEPHSHPILSALLYDWIDVSGFNNPGSWQIWPCGQRRQRCWKNRF